MQTHSQAMNMFARVAGVPGVILRWFGHDVPALRKPPKIVWNDNLPTQGTL
jgi:hypothetical protein